MKLAIISHTNHYRTTTGEIVGWGATVSEINHLAPHFETIYHAAVLHENSQVPPSSIPYVSDNIQFVALPPTGGKRMGDKLNIIMSIP
ncbi:MAG: capsular biosynthesis protein, partial [Marinirhabdus sp.]|nr:capsular biosynthesis protein [Marinirhabdus sp.]